MEMSMAFDSHKRYTLVLVEDEKGWSCWWRCPGWGSSRRRWSPDVSRLCARIRQRKGHAVAIGAVGRYLAESTYWVLTRREACRLRHRDAPISAAGPRPTLDRPRSPCRKIPYNLL